MRAQSFVLLCALVVGIVFAGGCAAERAPINRVQANAMSKHFFVGASLSDISDDPDFYWRNYVVDGPTNQSLVGVGSWSGVDRIRWEITEQQLVARKAYQIAQGADDTTTATKDPNGIIVAAYAIQSHFDIKRSYNPQTGEETNIIEENTTDRPWYEREYFRIDWATNQVDNPMWTSMFLGKVFGDITLTPLTYYESDPNGDNAPQFDEKTGYLDVTNHYLVSPAATSSPFSDLSGQVPTCLVVGLFTGSATYDCNAQEAVVRSSYWRVDTNDDFEPLENTAAPLDVVGNPGGIGDSVSVGILTPGQQGWDPGYGYVDKLYHRFAHIHDVWRESHQPYSLCNSNVDADNSGTADQCENNRTGYPYNHGSQCDTFVGKCTIPYRDRQIKTIGYWVNKEMPADLQDPLDPTGLPIGRGAVEDVVYSWNQLMSNAVAYSREIECRRTDADRPTCHALYFGPDKVMLSYGAWLVDQAVEATPALTLCHNPVRAYDRQSVCGPPGFQARLGDLRYNFLAYWPYDSQTPYGGIANWNADPLTGRILGAAAFVMGRSATYAAAMQRDVLQLAMGDIAVSDITDGVPAANYAHLLTNGAAPAALSQAEIDKRIAAVDAVHDMQTVNPVAIHGAAPADLLRGFLEVQKSAVSDPLDQSTAQLTFDALVAPLLGTRYETDLVDSHWLVGALGMAPGTSLDQGVLDQASPLRGLDSGRLHLWRDLVVEQLHLRGVCLLDDEAPIAGSVEMQGLAGYFQAKYAGLDKITRGQNIYHDLWIEAAKGISVHEFGHSLGMLHQFASSWDAMNYTPQYWQLRTNEGASTASCNGAPRGANDTCMGPRYLDPETADEQGLAGESRPSIEYYASTSVMEYQIERFGETMGLGTYDQHVMTTLYGRVLEVMDDAAHGGFAVGDQKNFAPRLETQLTEQERIFRNDPNPSVGSGVLPTHYTEVARQMKIFDPARDCRPATPDEAGRAEWRLVHGKICAPPSRDHAAWQDFLSDDLPFLANTPAPYWHTRSTSPSGGEQVRWFYRWGTTHNAYFHTNDSDAGADPYEVAVNTAHKFDVMYPFNYFRRQNRQYQFTAVPSLTADRYLERMRSYHWLVANQTAFYRAFGSALYAVLAGDDNLHRPYLMGVTEMFDLLARVLVTPELGDFSPATAFPDQVHTIYDVPICPPDCQAPPASFTLGPVDGRYIGEDYDTGPLAGGSWDYLHWIKHAGFGVEKELAARALADARPTLFVISRTNYLDGRGVDINFRNDLAVPLDRLVGGILSDDWESTGMWVTPSQGATPAPQLLDLTQATPARSSGALVLAPDLGYKQQLGTLVFLEAFSRLNTDMNLVDKMRVWIDGQVGGVNVPAAQQARFTDPATGYTYIGRKYGTEALDGKTVEKGIASRMVAHANSLLVASYAVETDANGKPILDSYGSPILVLDANGQPVPLNLDVSRIGDLTQYVGILDATKQLGEKLGYGPLGGGGQ